MVVVGAVAAGTPRTAATHTLTKLVVALNHAATAASIVSLAALPALTMLDLCLTGAPAMTFPAQWPAFPALTTSSVGFDETVATGSIQLVRSLASSACPALTTLRMRDRCVEAGPCGLVRAEVDGLAGLARLTTWDWAVADEAWLDGGASACGLREGVAGRSTSATEFTGWVAAALPQAVLHLSYRHGEEKGAA
eukprot:TRINITY_DN8565_c0_g1_i1.p2 TRINITY_DN8565_c0_g1~~TRINITY_DN8565_c0_g1_i1.p2  ORF type:complete len:194 (-),score=46.10 TRINITY_DN8565_c0_g1_i1:346-927(-)